MESTQTSTMSVADPVCVQRLCHECGAPMREVWRMMELGVLFRWLQCSRKGCPAVYLHRERSAETPADSDSRPVGYVA
jgi:hypothetical protein